MTIAFSPLGLWLSVSLFIAFARMVFVNCETFDRCNIFYDMNWAQALIFSLIILPALPVVGLVFVLFYVFLFIKYFVWNNVYHLFKLYWNKLGDM